MLEFFVLRDPFQMEAVEGRVANRQIVFCRYEVRIVSKISVGDPRDLIGLFGVVVDAQLVCSAVWKKLLEGRGLLRAGHGVHARNLELSGHRLVANRNLVHSLGLLGDS